MELASRLISMFSFVGDTVLDQFCGTGTTIEAAIKTHRSSASYEIEREYFQLAKSRFSQLTPDAHVSFIEPNSNDSRSASGLVSDSRAEQRA